MPFDLLKKKLMSRLKTMGIRIVKTYEEVLFANDVYCLYSELLLTMLPFVQYILTSLSEEYMRWLFVCMSVFLLLSFFHLVISRLGGIVM